MKNLQFLTRWFTDIAADFTHWWQDKFFQYSRRPKVCKVHGKRNTV